MKVLIFAGELPGFGGTETALLRSVEPLLATEHSFKVVLFEREEIKIQHKWLKTIPFTTAKIRNNSFFQIIDTFKGTIEAINNDNPDIVICLGFRFCVILNIVRKVFKKKYIIVNWQHSSYERVRILSAFNFLKLIDFSDFFLSIANGQKKQLIDMGVTENRIKVIHNPVENNSEVKFNNNDYTKNNTLRLIYVGRIVMGSPKEFKFLINSLTRYEGNWSLEVFGTGEDMKEAVSYVHKLKLEQKIIFHGFIEKPFENLDHFVDALILPSSSEGFPMVLIEAISRNIPCIASNCSVGPSDIIIEGINGYLYEPLNEKQFLETLNKIKQGYIEIPNVNRSIEFLRHPSFHDKFLDALYDFKRRKKE